MKARTTEQALRDSLGIPDHARQIVVFAETSHWDPNWIRTSEEYYEQRVRHTMDKAIAELQKEPRRVFSIECTFFLEMYWDRNPDRHDALRALMNSGRLRLTGTGVTTPDTVLPGAESILRDYLTGAEWLRANGVTQQPAVAYLPDNFGNSPALPTILKALGYRYAAVSRIDGMHFIGDDYRLPGWYPRPGSSAKLLTDLKTCDFLWRGPDGSQVLCHWNPFTYFQGDMLAHRGIIRWMNRLIGWNDRTSWNVGRKIEAFARQLSPLASTPYLFCPIGCDFNDPIPNLHELLDRYNWSRFPQNGIFAINAGLEDYLRLVEARAPVLPVIDLDPNPYWMGFYATRPRVKQRVRKTVRDLVEAERSLTHTHGARIGHPAGFRAIRRGWERLVISNHHDFVTGTTPDRVFHLEQTGWLTQAQDHATTAMGHAAEGRLPVVAARLPGLPAWTREGPVVEVQTDAYRIRLDERAGGCITGWWAGGIGENLVVGPSNDVVVYKDTGGLWRMGHEFAGGAFRKRRQASHGPATVRVEPLPDAVKVVVEAVVDGHATLRELWFRADTPAVRMRMVGAAGRRRTVTCRFVTGIRGSGLDMDVPGGVVRRPFVKVYDPTFWAAKNFVHLRDDATQRGIVAFVGGPASVSGRADGRLEWVMLRNAHKERAFGFLPVPAHPASGMNDDVDCFDYAVAFTAEGDWRANRLHITVERLLWDDPPGSRLPLEGAWPDGPARTDHADVRVRAVKPAEDGRGLVVRLISFDPAAGIVRVSYDGRQIERAVLCDALERDVRDLPVESGRLLIPVDHGILTARIFLKQAS
jgi:hypothetical protein